MFGGVFPNKAAYFCPVCIYVIQYFISQIILNYKNIPVFTADIPEWQNISKSGNF